MARIISRGRIRKGPQRRDITPRGRGTRVVRVLKVGVMKAVDLGLSAVLADPVLMRPCAVMSGMVSIIRVGHARAVVTGMDVSAGCEAWFFLT